MRQSTYPLDLMVSPGERKFDLSLLHFAIISLLSFPTRSIWKVELDFTSL
jgi:hypothetical protein